MGGCWREKTIVTTLEALGPGARAGLHFLLRDNNKKPTKNKAHKRGRDFTAQNYYSLLILKEKRKIRYAAERELKEAAYSHVQKHRRSDVCRPISQAIIFRPHFNFPNHKKSR